MLPCEPVVELLKYEPAALADSSQSLRPVEVFPSWQLVPRVVGPEMARPDPRLKSESFQLDVHPFSPVTTFFMCFGHGLSPEEEELSR